MGFLDRHREGAAGAKVPVSQLAAYQNGDSAVYDLTTRAEQARTDLLLAKGHPWLASDQVKTLLFSAWMADIYQRMAFTLTERAQQAPGTSGMLPQVTYRQALAFYEQVNRWLQQTDPLPTLAIAPLTVLPLNDAPAPHLQGMAGALEQLRFATEAAVSDLRGLSSFLPREFEVGLDKVQVSLDAAATNYEYTTGLMRGNPGTPEVLADVAAGVQKVVSAYLLIGQQLAMPELIDPSLRPKRPVKKAPKPGSLPEFEPTIKTSQSLAQRIGFDPWILSDPEVRQRRGNDPEAIKALQCFWEADPDPQATYSLYTLFTQEVAAGTVTQQTGEAIKDCPWCPSFAAVKTISLAGERITQGEAFAPHFGLRSGKFERTILRLGRSATAGRRQLASFQPDTDEVPSWAWSLVDPDLRDAKKANRAASKQLEALVKADTSPGETQAIQEAIDAAAQTGTLARRVGESLKVCPWSPSYTALTSISVAGEHFAAGEILAYQPAVKDGHLERNLVRLGRDTSVAAPRSLPPFSA